MEADSGDYGSISNFVFDHSICHKSNRPQLYRMKIKNEWKTRLGLKT